MSTLTSNRAESMVDLVIRGYGHIEGMIQFAKDNGVALDAEETTAVNRLVDDVRKAELKNERALFQRKPVPAKQKFISNRTESMVDLVMRGYGNIEGLIQFAKDNSVALDAEETAPVERVIDTAVKEQLEQSFFFSVAKKQPVRSKVTSNVSESMVDLVMRTYGNIEGMIQFAKDNSVALDDVEATVTERLVNNVLKQELQHERVLFPSRVVKATFTQVVNNGQNLVDLCLQELGDIEGLIDFLRDNGFTPNTDPLVDTEIKVVTARVADEKIRTFYRSLNYRVNTGQPVGTEVITGFRILEDGSYRLLESGDKRKLE